MVYESVNVELYYLVVLVPEVCVKCLNDKATVQTKEPKLNV